MSSTRSPPSVRKVKPALLGASLAMPGPFDYAAGVSWMQHKLPYLYGFDLRGALARHISAGRPPMSAF